MLATIATQTPTDRPEGGEDKSKLKFWEVPYIEVLQLSVANVKGAMNLQCRAAAGLRCHLNIMAILRRRRFY